MTAPGVGNLPPGPAASSSGTATAPGTSGGAGGTQQAGGGAPRRINAHVRIVWLALPFVLVLVVLSRNSAYQAWLPFVFALAAVALFYGLGVVVAGRVNPLELAMGADGRLSSSIFQYVVWTSVVVFSYVLLWSTRAIFGQGPDKLRAISELPENLLLAMGFSVTTLAGAKAITMSFVRGGELSKEKPAEGEANAGLLTKDDLKTPDLAKVQMLVWTLIAAVMYLVNVFKAQADFQTCGTAGHPACQIPDIDGVLMVLMGLAQGAYLGNKLTTRETPRLSRTDPITGGRGAIVKILGEAFGTQSGGEIRLNGKPLPARNWKETEIEVAVPSRRPSDSGVWRFGEIAQFEVVASGRSGLNSVPFQIAPPLLMQLDKPSAKPKEDVTITGQHFGTEADGAVVTLNGEPVPSAGVVWGDARIVFKVPPTDKGGAPWPAAANAKPVEVRVQVGDQVSPTSQALNVGQ